MGAAAGDKIPSTTQPTTCLEKAVRVQPKLMLLARLSLCAHVLTFAYF